jgi:hypothetical protein
MASRGYTRSDDDVYDWPTAKDFLDEDIYNELCVDESEYESYVKNQMGALHEAE